MMSAQGWRTVPLREIAPEVRGSAVLAAGTGYELWSVPSFSNGRPEEVDGADVGSAKRPVEPNDVLICKINPRINRVWKVGPYRGRPQVASPEWIAVRPVAVGEVDPDFLRHYLSSPRFREWIVGEVSGVTGSHTRAKPAQVMAWLVPAPPLPEQRRIVEILEGHLSRLDAAEAGLRAAHRRLESLQDRLIVDAITGASVPGPRTHDTPFDGGASDGDLPSIPSGWRWTRLGDVADVVGGVTKDAKKQSNPGFVEVPYLRVANVQRGSLKLDNVTSIRVPPAKAESLALLPGDVLLNEGGDRDKLARGWVWQGEIEGCIHQNHVFRARVRGDLDPYFLSWTANTIGGRWAERNGKQSVNLASISLSMIRRMPVIAPPGDVSNRIVTALHEQLAATRRLAAELNIANSRSRAMRKGILSAAFQGKLTGRRTDVEVIEELAL